MIFIYNVILQTINFKNIGEFSAETILKILPVFVSVFFIIMCLNQFYNRYINVFKWKIILTNFRLIVIDKNNKLIKEFYLESFPKLSFNENAYNNGTLIIGETVRTKEFPYRGYESLSFDLYNIKDVKSIHCYIKNKIEVKKEI